MGFLTSVMSAPWMGAKRETETAERSDQMLAAQLSLFPKAFSILLMMVALTGTLEGTQ